MNVKNDGKNVDGFMAALIVIFGTICALILVLGISYGLVALLTYLICLCFGWNWSWIFALGIWILAIFLKWMHKYITSHGGKNE